MSVRVNLLPREVEERNKASRQRAALAAAGVGFLALLVALYIFQLGRVSAAEDVLAAEEARLAELNAELATLQEFQELEARAAAADSTMQTLLGGEASFAGVLQDLAAVMPTDADLAALAIVMAEAPEAPQLGGTRQVYGTLTASGRTIRGHAPGLERLLLELDKVAAFDNVYFSSSSLDEEGGFALFSLDLDLGAEVLTRRYVNGLPEELR